MDIDGIRVEELLLAVYDGDGSLVKSEVNGVVTYYLGKYYEKTVQNGHYAETCAECFFSKKHYSAGSSIIAVRTVVDGTQDTLNWLVGDHLGSTSLVTDSAGAVVSEVRYSAFGEMRYLNGETVTDLLYTGQKLEEELGLYYYVARWYDPYLNRFLSPDSIIPDPGSSTAYDRYAYVQNNPTKYSDPTGHYGCKPGFDGGDCNPHKNRKELSNYVFIFSCGLGTDCGGNSPGKAEGYGEGGVAEVPFQPLRKEIEALGGTVIYTGKHTVKGEKLLYSDEVKAKIEENQNMKGVFLIGHSYGTGANILAAYDLITPEGNTNNLAGIVILDSYLVTGNGEEFNLGDYDTQDKADIVVNLIPSYTAHSLDHEADPNWKTDFPRVGMGPGPALSQSHLELANSPVMTKNVLNFILEVVFSK